MRTTALIVSISIVQNCDAGFPTAFTYSPQSQSGSPQSQSGALGLMPMPAEPWQSNEMRRVHRQNNFFPAVDPRHGGLRATLAQDSLLAPSDPSSLELPASPPEVVAREKEAPFKTVEMPPPADPADRMAPGISTNGFNLALVSRLPQPNVAAPGSATLDASEANKYVVTSTAATTSTGSVVSQQPLAIDDSRSPVRTAVHAASRYESEGNLSAAINAFHYALQIDDTDRLALIAFARLKHRLGDLDGAIVTYRQSLKHHPNDSVAMNDVAICYARMGQLDEAEIALQSAVNLAPKNRRYINNLATVLVEQGQENEALKLLAAEYGDALGHYNLGHLYVERALYPEAARQFRATLQMDPSFEPAAEMITRLGAAGYEVANVPSLSIAQSVSPATHAEGISQSQSQSESESNSNSNSNLKTPPEPGGPIRMEHPATIQQSQLQSQQREHWNFLQ